MKIATLIVSSNSEDPHYSPWSKQFQQLISACGYTVELAYWPRENKPEFTGELFTPLLPLHQVQSWQQSLPPTQANKPVIGLCPSPANAADFTTYIQQLPMTVDGVLAPDMTADEARRVIAISRFHASVRNHWHREKEQLLAKLEERKWIDAAKGILSRMKNISEPEAYEFLRKEAMTQRKRLVDIAASIVKVYKLLHDQTDLTS